MQAINSLLNLGLKWPSIDGYFFYKQWLKQSNDNKWSNYLFR